jgi:parvulin-like peptidyl-prolyl isomerase
MTEVLKISNRIIKSEEIVPLLACYQLLPQLLRELVTDQVIAEIGCTWEEQAQCLQQFHQQQKISSAPEQQAWLTKNHLTERQLATLVTRPLRIARYKQATWGAKLESYFLQRKSQLDRAIYSLIRLEDLGIAQELYFRINEGEQSFTLLAREYSQGPEAQTGGLIGPAELATLHPTLAKVLTISKPEQLWAPIKLGQWWVIIRLEKFIPAQLDEPMRQRLLDELFQNWLQEQLENLGPLVPFGPTETQDSLALLGIGQ